MKLRVIILTCLTVLCSLLIVEILGSDKNGNLNVNYLDIGQGDSTLIETPTKGEILIDGGPDKVVLKRLGEKLNFFQKDIDVVIATHEDSDHISGLIYVLEKYNVKILIVPWWNTEEAIPKKLEEIANRKNVKVLRIEKPEEIKTRDGVTIKILYPVSKMEGRDTNDKSIVTQINYGKINFMSTGDLPQAAEIYLTNVYGENLKSNVLKLGHHGSDTSSNPLFLKTVNPEVAIVSAGKNNRYGHPHKSVLDLCEKFKIKVLSTIDLGSISIETDGNTFWVK